jgi:hypothetical protein
MPHSTQEYAFEFRVLDLVGGLCIRLAGEARRMLLCFDRDGALLKAAIGADAAPDAALDVWLLYDPFDAPEYTYVEWHGVSRQTMERLMGAAFVAADFEATGPRRPRRRTLQDFPSDWGVMFW